MSEKKNVKHDDIPQRSVALCFRCDEMFDHCCVTNLPLSLFMVAVCNRADHYIFMMWFLLLSSFYLFSSPNFSVRRLDVYHTFTHGVALE